MGVAAHDEVEGARGQVASQLHIPHALDRGRGGAGAVAQVAEQDDHIAHGAQGRQQVLQGLQGVRHRPPALGQGMQLAGRSQADDAYPHALHHEDGRRVDEVRQMGAAHQVGREQGEGGVRADGVGQEPGAHVQVVVAQGRGIETGRGVDPIAGVDLVALRVLAQELVEDRAHQVIPGGEGQHPGVGVSPDPSTQLPQAPDDAGEDGPIPVGGEAGDVTVQVVDVKDLQVEALLGPQQAAVRQLHAWIGDDVPHRPRGGIPGQQEQQGFVPTVGVGSSSDQAQLTRRWWLR